MLTSPDHPNGTSRLSEAAAKIGLSDDALIVNVQGDEPEVEPEAIDAAVSVLSAWRTHARRLLDRHSSRAVRATKTREISTA